jgi:hypothetical protein
MPMSKLPIGNVIDSDDEHTWTPIAAHVGHRRILADSEGTVYESIEITSEGQEGQLRVALTGYTDYEKVLSL